MFLKEFSVTQICLFLFASLTYGYQQREVKGAVGVTPSSKITLEEPKKLNSGSLLNSDKTLSPVQVPVENDENGFIEVKESEIPEGSLVYVLEEPIDRQTDGEILKTADNIVFRPLFRYRSKQEAQRRNSNRIRRRYFIPKRSYRQTYHYPYYYSQRYY